MQAVAPKNDDAPVVGGGVRDQTLHDKDITFANRPFPAKLHELLGCAGLKWPEGRVRFRELALTPGVFWNSDLALIAADLLAGRPWGPAERPGLFHDDGVVVPVGVAVEVWTGSPEAAVHWVNLLAREAAVEWAPVLIDWVSESARSGCWTLPRLAGELRDVAAQLEGVAA